MRCTLGAHCMHGRHNYDYTRIIITLLSTDNYNYKLPAPHSMDQTSFPMSCNEVLPEWISLKTDVWSFGAMVINFFVGSRGPSSQREVRECEFKLLYLQWLSVCREYMVSSHTMPASTVYTLCIHIYSCTSEIPLSSLM